jgi:hypothetical protein
MWLFGGYDSAMKTADDVVTARVPSKSGNGA